ncbi:MAG: hypothetical protein GY714_18070 [Desulfobacterales bacterium]|nr:hypothetical protein [Desulfobacterales bacterium]
MSGVISTGNHPKALWPGVKAWFGRTYDEWDVKYTDLFSMDTSSQNYEELVEATGFGLAPVKNQGTSTTYDSETQGTINRFVHVAYSLGYIVTREEFDDDLYEMVSKRRAPAIAFSMRQTKEIVAANVYNRAFSSSYTYGDGVSLINSSHPNVSGNQSNVLAVAADFSESSLEDMTIQMMNATNSRGLNIPIRPTCLIGPTSLVYEFERVLKSRLQPDTANNAINALAAKGIVPKTSINPYLTDTDAWFMRGNVPNGMTGFDRVKGGALTQDTDFDTDNLKAKDYQRYSFGVGDFRDIWGTPGA